MKLSDTNQKSSKELLDMHVDAIYAVRDAQADQRHIEEALMDRLIRAKRFDCFSLNRARMGRAIRNGELD